MKSEAMKSEAMKSEAMKSEAMSPGNQQLLAQYSQALSLMASDSGFAALVNNPAFANALMASTASVNAVAK